MRHVEAHHERVRLAAKDRVGRFRVSEDVGLGRRVHVAVHEEGPPEHHELLQPPGAGRVEHEGQRHVGERGQGEDRHLPRVSTDLVRDELGGRHRLGGSQGRGEGGGVPEAVGAVDEVRDALLRGRGQERDQ